MTIRIRQHIPAFVDYRSEPPFADISSAADLDAVGWVAAYKEDPDFYRFSYSDNFLMAEYEEGRRWWVVARCSELVPGLPAWEAK